MSPNPSDAKYAAARKYPKKNRSMDFLPGDTTFQIYLNGYFCPFLCFLVDKWRVVLKGETPDYINASAISVSPYMCTCNTLIVCGIVAVVLDSFIAGLQAAEGLHHSPKSHGIHCQRFLEDGP